MNVLVRLLDMFAHTISTEADVLKVIMNTEMSILFTSQEVSTRK